MGDAFRLENPAQPPTVTDAPADLVLVLEASTGAASVALLRGDALLGVRAVAMGASRDDAMFPAIQTLLADADVAVHDLDAIVCGAGPGSFTSLRIAAALAKGLSHAASVPLYAVPSLLLAAAAFAAHATSHAGSPASDGRLLVHSDALRDERYVMPVHVHADGTVRADGDVERVPVAALAMRAGDRVLLAVAGGSATFAAPVASPDAAALTRVAGWRTHGAVDTATWEPASGRLAEAQVKWEAQHQRPLEIG